MNTVNFKEKPEGGAGQGEENGCCDGSDNLNNDENIQQEEVVDEEKIDGEEIDESKIVELDLEAELKSENLKLKAENEKIHNEFKTLQERLSRTAAEYDNFRKRTAKEKEAIYSEVCKDILKEMLPVLDNLERAMQVEGDMEDLKKGVEMTIRQFNTGLEKLNVEEISTEGQFDPNIHNAVMHVEDDKYDKNSIVEVFQKGYKREDKIIRYSMVKVAN
ncbi:nucleotide exchange factor GrpE [Clostridium sp. WILCCON 0269]|uniref:Protein GrpE n=1 Tax=Candidatus Clostridium eludens TaxID=3381663 RepID=A0ABW8SJ51_9CLOT